MLSFWLVLVPALVAGCAAISASVLWLAWRLTPKTTARCWAAALVLGPLSAFCITLVLTALGSFGFSAHAAYPVGALRAFVILLLVLPVFWFKLTARVLAGR